MDYLLSLVETEHDTRIEGFERKFLAEAFSQIDKRQFMNLPDHVVKRKIVDIMGAVLNKVRELDMHELQYKMLVSGGNNLPNGMMDKKKEDIRIGSLFGVVDVDKLLDKMVYHHVMLDSRYRNLSYSNLCWEYVFNKQNLSGTFTTDAPLKNIMQVKLYKPMIPITPGYTNFEHRNVGILIDEFKIQSMILSENVRAHWILKTTDRSIWTKKSTCNFDDEDFVNNNYKFDKIKIVDRLTIRVNNLTEDIPFLPESDMASMSYGSITTFTTDNPHLLTGYPLNTSFQEITYILVTGFTTSDPITDIAVINNINSVRKHKAIITGAATITLDINTSGITPLSGLKVRVFYESRRILIPLVLVGEEDDKDSDAVGFIKKH